MRGILYAVRSNLRCSGSCHGRTHLARAGAGPADLRERIHEDELASCRLLMDGLRDLGVTSGSAVGAFEDRVMALEGTTERMALLEDMRARHVDPLAAVAGWLAEG